LLEHYFINQRAVRFVRNRFAVLPNFLNFLLSCEKENIFKLYEPMPQLKLKVVHTV
jgi:hypothetical protein